MKRFTNKRINHALAFLLLFLQITVINLPLTHSHFLSHDIHHDGFKHSDGLASARSSEATPCEPMIHGVGDHEHHLHFFKELNRNTSKRDTPQFVYYYVHILDKYNLGFCTTRPMTTTGEFILSPDPLLMLYTTDLPPPTA